MSKAHNIIISISNKPHRLRWGMVYYVQMAYNFHQQKVCDSINLYAEFHRLEESDFDALKADYYRLLTDIRSGDYENWHWGFTFYVQMASNLLGVSINQAIINFNETYRANSMTEEDYLVLSQMHENCLKWKI